MGARPDEALAAQASDGSSRKWWALIAICGGTFMLLVDLTIVQVALPRIQRELHASFTNLQWVIDAYALTLSALILTSGTLADRVGRKRVFVGGLASVHARLAAVRPVRQHQLADLRTGSAGLWRRCHVRDLACTRRAGVPWARAGGRDRRVGSDGRRGRGSGALDRRPAHRWSRLAVDLLRQHPDRPLDDVHLRDADGQRARSRRRAA